VTGRERTIWTARHFCLQTIGIIFKHSFHDTVLSSPPLFQPRYCNTGTRVVGVRKVIVPSRNILLLFATRADLPRTQSGVFRFFEADRAWPGEFTAFQLHIAKAGRFDTRGSRVNSTYHGKGNWRAGGKDRDAKYTRGD